MDIYTKIYLINIICAFCVDIWGRFVYNKLVMLWVNATLLSLPATLIYAIVKA